mgnify:CR=1 FL=1
MTAGTQGVFDRVGADAWILATLAAVLFQTARFALQKQLTLDGLSALAATWARFLWATPFLLVAFVAWVQVFEPTLPALSPQFWLLISVGSIAQILATLCVLRLFQMRAFAIGLTFKKSEALQTGLLGWLALGDRLSLGGVIALIAGFVSLRVLSSTSGSTNSGDGVRSAGLGIASGALFAITGVAFRAAILEIDALTEVQAALSLLIATTLQTTFLSTWFLALDLTQVRKTLLAWRSGIVLGVLSLLGSYAWFVAFALQNAAYVYALGQVELIAAVFVGYLIFGEKPGRRELLGMASLAASLVALVVLA